MFETENMILEMIRHEDNCPDLLYHYCKKESAAYLLNYGADISARSLVKSPNDDEEYRAGVELFCDFIKTRKIVSQGLSALIRTNVLENIKHGEKTNNSIIPFAFCLTETFNSPYHWDEFVKDGGGYCFAFSRQKLIDACRDVRNTRKASLQLARCYYIGYDDEKINSICEAICRDRADDFASLISSNGFDAESGIRIMQQVCMFAMCVKRAKYYPEREWRITMVASNAKEANEEGYLATGIKEFCCRKDIMSIMRGCLSSPAGNQRELQTELFKFLVTRGGKDL